MAFRLSLPRREVDPGWALRGFLLALLVMVLARVIDSLIYDQIGITGEAYTVIETLAILAFWMGVGWLAVALGNLAARAIIASPRIQARSVDAHLVRVATRTLSLALLFVVVLEAAGELGIPLSATLHRVRGRRHRHRAGGPAHPGELHREPHPVRGPAGAGRRSVPLR